MHKVSVLSANGAGATGREMKLYLDTSVSKYKDEFYGGPMPAYARYPVENLLERALACEFSIVTSDIVSRELENKFPYYASCYFDDINRLKKHKKIALADTTKLRKEIASLERIWRVGWRDCSHILMARDNAEAFVSWEKKHKKIGKAVGINVLRPDEF